MPESTSSGIAMLLLRLPYHLSQAHWSLYNLASPPRLKLFTFRDLLTWLHDPFGTPLSFPALDNLHLR